MTTLLCGAGIAAAGSNPRARKPPAHAASRIQQNRLRLLSFSTFFTLQENRHQHKLSDGVIYIRKRCAKVFACPEAGRNALKSQKLFRFHVTIGWCSRSPACQYGANTREQMDTRVVVS